jgi:Rod binding domain-containing protein
MSGAAIALAGPHPTRENGAGSPAKRDDPAKIYDAAKQFEALLITQILRSARQAGEGWLGSGGDSSSDCASGFAEEQFAAAMAKGGGLGLANIIAAGLAKAQAETSDEAMKKPA